MKKYYLIAGIMIAIIVTATFLFSSGEKKVMGNQSRITIYTMNPDGSLSTTTPFITFLTATQSSNNNATSSRESGIMDMEGADKVTGVFAGVASSSAKLCLKMNYSNNKVDWYEMIIPSTASSTKQYITAGSEWGTGGKSGEQRNYDVNISNDGCFLASLDTSTTTGAFIFDNNVGYRYGKVTATTTGNVGLHLEIQVLKQIP